MAQKGYDIITSGYVSMDRIIKIKNPLRLHYSSLISNQDNSNIYYGGCSINIAFLLANLGYKTLPIVRVGKDYKDIGFWDFLCQGQVCTEAIEVVPEDTTSNCYLFEDEQGQHITVYYPGAQAEKYFKPMPDHFFQQAKIAVITVGSRSDSMEFFYQCKKNDVFLVFGMKADFNAFSSQVLTQLLHHSKIIFTNEVERKEIEQRLGLHSIEDLLIQAKAEIIITTLGKEGSIFYQKKDGKIHSGTVPAVDSSAVVDTTGSGDAYIAGFLYGYLHQYSVEKCCYMGSTMASFIIETMGCCTNAPKEAELKDRYQKGGYKL